MKEIHVCQMKSNALSFPTGDNNTIAKFTCLLPAVLLVKLVAFLYLSFVLFCVYTQSTYLFKIAHDFFKVKVQMSTHTCFVFFRGGGG